ncbi:MAG: hypothetical protein ACI9E1_002218 [Cryomorphaceae bacterium]|jgi:hypothetical protein
MKIIRNMCLLLILLMVGSCEKPKKSLETGIYRGENQNNYEIWSSAINPIAHTGHAIAFDLNTNEYLYCVARDMVQEPHENYPKRGIFSID